jgi:hypothetical protein
MPLSRQEFDDIHESVWEAMEFVAIPVTFFRAEPEEVDPLYRESASGDDPMVPFAALMGSVADKTKPEILTKFGVAEQADILVFVPRKLVSLWEAEHEETFALTVGMEFETKGTRYNITKKPVTDDLPVQDVDEDGHPVYGTDWIGLVVVGTIKPRK